MTTRSTVLPQPLNPRDPSQLTQHLLPGDRVRITTTRLARTILTVVETNPPSPERPRLVLRAPPLTNSAHESIQHAVYHCTTGESTPTMSVVEYTHTRRETTSRCIGTLTTIARLPRLSQRTAADTRREVTWDE